MLDIRLDLCHSLAADSQNFTTCRKYIKVALFDGEFGKATKIERDIICRNYTQAAANLKRIGNFFRDMYDKDAKDELRHPSASVIAELKVGAVVITIAEKVQTADGKNKLQDVIIYDIPIDNGKMSGYTRKVVTTLDKDLY